jgi:hypothetical protein
VDIVPGGGVQGSLADINPTYATTFQTFSANRLFVPLGSNITDASFFIPGTNGGVAATTTAFGAVFANVGLANTTSIELFNQSTLLGKFFAPTASRGLSFLGIQFNAGELITHVRLTTGNSSLGPHDGGGINVVAMDNFIYGEPRASVPEPSTLLLLGLAFLGLVLWRKKMDTCAKKNMA